MTDRSTPRDPVDLTRRSAFAWVAGIVVVMTALIGLMTLLPFWDDVSGAGSGAYLGVLALVFGDAVFPVLPGETTLNAAAVGASQGDLSLGVVILAGSFGAVLGDSAVYWIARSLRGPWHDKLMNTAEQPKANSFLKVFKNRAPLMIVFGRYIPGVRLVVNVTMGSVVRLPYPEFLRWSALAGFLWSTYTCVLGYAVATVLDSRPLAAIVISGLITSAALVAIGWTLRRGMKQEAAQEAAARDSAA